MIFSKAIKQYTCIFSSRSKITKMQAAVNKTLFSSFLEDLTSTSSLLMVSLHINGGHSKVPGGSEQGTRMHGLHNGQHGGWDACGALVPWLHDAVLLIGETTS